MTGGNDAIATGGKCPVIEILRRKSPVIINGEGKRKAPYLATSGTQADGDTTVRVAGETTTVLQFREGWEFRFFLSPCIAFFSFLR